MRTHASSEGGSEGEELVGGVGASVMFPVCAAIGGACPPRHARRSALSLGERNLRYVRREVCQAPKVEQTARKLGRVRGRSFVLADEKGMVGE